MINHIARVWLPALGLLVLAACSGTVSTRDDSTHGGTEVYPLTLEDAVLIMRSAMDKEFESDKISAVLSPHRGFQGKIRLLSDIDTITVYAVPARGRGPDGQQVDGFAFEVKHSGTYPLGGIPKAKAVLADVVAGADRLVKSLPAVE